VPRIFENIEQDFVTDLRKSLAESTRADFCVGYFRLRGWGLIADLVDKYRGGNSCCRVLVGMHRRKRTQTSTSSRPSATPISNWLTSTWKSQAWPRRYSRT